MTRPHARSSKDREERTTGKQPRPESASLRPGRAPRGPRREGLPEAAAFPRRCARPRVTLTRRQRDRPRRRPPHPGGPGLERSWPSMPTQSRSPKARPSRQRPLPTADAQASRFPTSCRRLAAPGRTRSPGAHASPPPRRPWRGSHHPPAAAPAAPAAPGPACAPHPSPPPWPYCSPAAVPGLQATPRTQAAPTHGSGVWEKPEDRVQPQGT